MKIAERVAADLRRQIAAGDFVETGSLGSEAELIERYGASRPSVREAIRILESEALVEVTRGARSVKVKSPDTRTPARHLSLLLHSLKVSLRDVYGARLMVEPGAARMTAQNSWDTAPAVLREIIEAEEALLDDPMMFGRMTVTFHQTLVELAGNQTIDALVKSLGHIFLAHSDVLFREYEGQRAYLEKGVKAHRRLVDLIADCRPHEAEEFWRNHLEFVQRDHYLPDAQYGEIVDILD
ncbi:FCD domain-containing protein [Rhodobacterales bacterium HKCCE2091]|nr:FCD domain-containing protein [Rhodobacterales bacterium HKCCE2091]